MVSAASGQDDQPVLAQGKQVHRHSRSIPLSSSLNYKGEANVEKNLSLPEKWLLEIFNCPISRNLNSIISPRTLYAL